MAITRAQIVRQLYKDGKRVGLRFGDKGPGEERGSRGRSDAESQYGGGSYDSGSNTSDRGQSFGIGRNPSMAGQGANERPTNPVDEVALTSSTNRNFINDARRAVTPLGNKFFGNNFAGVPKIILNAISPNPFGYNISPKTPNTRGGEGKPIIPIYNMAQESRTTEENDDEEELTELQRMLRDRGDVAVRYAADGGIMNEDIIGGEFDFESARQMYGLGKLVKKATRAVKKVASSPIGKAALAYTLTGGLGNLAQGQGFFQGFTSPTTFLGKSKMANLFTGKGLKGALFGLPGGNKLVADTAGILGSGGKFSVLKGITAASILPLLGLGTGDESEEEAQAIIDNSGIDPAAIREAYLSDKQYLARRFRAEGGPAEGKEPVAKKVMPLLDMDGMEKDYRETGGFVPIGRMEKADDVPARLSKNEFVFTADAVRNAGDGDIDKGAEVMYNMMKHLEDGGDVSEESQGLEGARNMFQTSQRLEEVL